MMDEAAVTDEPASPSSSASSSASATRQRTVAKANLASSLVEKKGPFGRFRFTLPRVKRNNKTDPTDDSALMNPPKKVKRERSFLRNVTSRKSTPTLGKVKDSKSTSSIASTLVRKISFISKTKSDRKASRESERSETSPATSHEEIEVGAEGAGAFQPLTPMDMNSLLDPAIATTTTTTTITTTTSTTTTKTTTGTITTAAAAATAATVATVASDAIAASDTNSDSGVAGGVEPNISCIDQWASTDAASDPLLGPPTERAHLVDTGTSTDTGTNVETSPRAAADQAGSPLKALSVSEHTSKLRAAWMSLPGSPSVAGTGAEASSAKTATNTTAKTAREQILSITAPAWESQQREKRRRDAKADGANATDAEPGTSHSGEFFTPTDSPDADEYFEDVATKSVLTLTPASKAVSVDLAPTTSASVSASVPVLETSTTSKSEPESVAAGSASVTVTPESPRATSAAPTLAPSEDILARPEILQQLEAGHLEEPLGVAADAAVEDLMAEARARLSQNLGVSTPSASPSVQQGGGGGGGEKREHLYKILVIGELGTGKTSIIKRYVHQFFSQHYRATIGVDFALKVLNWDANTIIRLQLWDIAGQERFGNMTRVYYKEAVAAFVVFDVTRHATFDAVLKWKQDLDSKVQLPDGSAIPCILLANKCDLQKEGLVNYPGKMDEYCKDRGFAGWFEISAKENINIEEAARLLVTKILANEHAGAQGEAARDADTLHLGSNASQDESRSRCSC